MLRSLEAHKAQCRAESSGSPGPGLAVPCTTSATPSSPNAALIEALPSGVTTDWDQLEQAVRRIRDPKYTLKEFHGHMVEAFPELALYTCSPSSGGSSHAEEVLSSGRSRSEELARTFGAFYALYWLMRLDLDGKQGFCFGYDDNFDMRPVPQRMETKKKVSFDAAQHVEKQLNCFSKFPWDECTKLLVTAGLLTLPEEVDDKGLKEPVVHHDRLKAMLALTAIHDVMKNESLCPTVQHGHAPFCGYQEGQVILDHDVALDYILSQFGHMLPSYNGLDEPSQKLVKFATGKMGFNNGWLVQGESPPGALFHTFKRLIDEGAASSEDVAFYFAHWLTDLAGAEPTPLRGSEKMVQKLPLHVSHAFFASFPYVWRLSSSTETQVLQEYLEARWLGDEKLGPLPAGEESIALMRLALQLQSHSELLRPAFDRLEQEDRDLLVDEMARTGLPGQDFAGTRQRPGQPALLVYYAPAFLQRNSGHLTSALSILAEVYRQGRKLFPIMPKIVDESGEDKHSERQHHTATLRVEQIKDLSPTQVGSVSATWVTDVEGWFLVQKSDLDAVLERHPLHMMHTFEEEGVVHRFCNWAGATMAMSMSVKESCERHGSQELLAGDDKTQDAPPLAAQRTKDSLPQPGQRTSDSLPQLGQRTSDPPAYVHTKASLGSSGTADGLPPLPEVVPPGPRGRSLTSPRTRTTRPSRFFSCPVAPDLATP